MNTEINNLLQKQHVVRDEVLRTSVVNRMTLAMLRDIQREKEEMMERMKKTQNYHAAK